MSEKSHVSMATNLCTVCAHEFDTGEILMDMRLQQTFERRTLTGISLCPSCLKKKEDGYTALVGVGNKHAGQEKLQWNEAIRTGLILWVRLSAAKRIFTCEVNDTVNFVNQEIIDRILEDAKGLVEFEEEKDGSENTESGECKPNQGAVQESVHDRETPSNP